MADGAAHLVDHVLPFGADYRQWRGDHCARRSRTPALGTTRSQQQAYVDPAPKGGDGGDGVISPNRDGGFAAGRRWCDHHAERWFGGSTTAPSSLREEHNRVQCPKRASAQARTGHQAYCSASAALATTTA
jgi:hypothetical protein